MALPNGIQRFYQHIQPDTSDPTSREPALILGRKSFGRGCSYVLMLSSAYKFMPQNEEEMAVMLASARMATRALNLNYDDLRTVRQVADIIIDGLDELVHMAPEDDAHFKQGGPKATGTITVDGQAHEFEIFH